MAKTPTYFNIFSRNILQHPQRVKRDVCAFARHDVVVDLDAQYVANFPQVLGHVDVHFWLRLLSRHRLCIKIFLSFVGKPN